MNEILSDISFREILGHIVLIFAASVAISVPQSLTVLNVMSLFWRGMSKVLKYMSWAVTIFAGALCSLLYIEFSEIAPDAEWSAILYNAQLHQPFWSGARGLYIAIILVAACGFIILAAAPLRETPPLLLVLAMASQYPLAATCIVWCIQVGFRANMAPLLVLPVNVIIIMLSMFRMKISEWQALSEERPQTETKNVLVRKAGALLNNSRMWPLCAFIAAIPLLAIMVGISVLFGQQPDALIKAWTETADWRLSGRTAPPNLYYDEHYLCTVAAGGHERIVKPIRMGERHGHRVVVNRQLEIANAFEQIIEERTPHFHKAVRGFYDRCGFPIARLIKTKTACDIVYFIMKPLEWTFLCVIYLSDARPEDRIAVQYMPGYPSFQKELRESRRQ